MIDGTRESKILGGGGCFVRFSYSVYGLVLDGFSLFASGC